MKNLFSVGIAVAYLLTASGALQADTLLEANLKDRVDAILGLMGYSLTPDVTTGSLSISNDPTDNPGISMGSLGGGFTCSKNFPLYLEGTVGTSHYDPAFLSSNGQITQRIPTKWDSLALTGGVGWDFPVANNLKFRPILNLSRGHVEIESTIAGQIPKSRVSDEIEFIKKGEVNMHGIGGTLMLDYERYQARNEIDLEVRYTDIQLQNVGAPSAIQGNADAQSLSVWSRWRAPTGLQTLKKPLRYVLEAAHTSFLGDLRGTLGFNSLSSIGVGLELDSSAYKVVVDRTRLLFRYLFGDDVRGTSVGLAVSF